MKNFKICNAILRNRPLLFILSAHYSSSRIASLLLSTNTNPNVQEGFLSTVSYRRSRLARWNSISFAQTQSTDNFPSNCTSEQKTDKLEIKTRKIPKNNESISYRRIKTQLIMESFLKDAFIFLVSINVSQIRPRLSIVIKRRRELKSRSRSIATIDLFTSLV